VTQAVGLSEAPVPPLHLVQADTNHNEEQVTTAERLADSSAEVEAALDTSKKSPQPPLRPAKRPQAHAHAQTQTTSRQAMASQPGAMRSPQTKAAAVPLRTQPTASSQAIAPISHASETKRSPAAKGTSGLRSPGASVGKDMREHSGKRL
jgi:hypothetical protein